MFYPFIKFESGSNETFNPFLFFLLPSKFAGKNVEFYGSGQSRATMSSVHDNVEANRDKLLTHFDLFTTWYTYLGFTEQTISSERGKSIFFSRVEEERKCSDVFIKEEFCKCLHPN